MSQRKQVVWIHTFFFWFSNSTIFLSNYFQNSTIFFYKKNVEKKACNFGLISRSIKYIDFTIGNTHKPHNTQTRLCRNEFTLRNLPNFDRNNFRRRRPRKNQVLCWNISGFSFWKHPKCTSIYSFFEFYTFFVEFWRSGILQLNCRIIFKTTIVEFYNFFVEKKRSDP